MTYDRWQDLRESIREKYDIEEELHKQNDDGIGTCETIVFVGPVGKIRLELLKRISFSARLSMSKSSLARLSERWASLFWLIRTKVERKIASRETMSVSNI